MGSWKFMDDVIYRALMKRHKVELFLCRDEEGGFGIKINGKIAFRNLPFELFENELEDEKEIRLWEKYHPEKAKVSVSEKTGGKK